MFSCGNSLSQVLGEQASLASLWKVVFSEQNSGWPDLPDYHSFSQITVRICWLKPDWSILGGQNLLSIHEAQNWQRYLWRPKLEYLWGPELTGVFMMPILNRVFLRPSQGPKLTEVLYSLWPKHTGVFMGAKTSSSIHGAKMYSCICGDQDIQEYSWGPKHTGVFMGG